MCWGVSEDLGAIVADLAAKGVRFEHYPGIGRLEACPEQGRRGDVHVIAGPNAGGGPNGADARLVWFKDPDGNILHINNL